MKKLLLALCAGVAISASAQTYKVGEAFSYNINITPNFEWFGNTQSIYDNNANWPAVTLQGCASLEDNLGLGMFWFAQYSANMGLAEDAAVEEQQPGPQARFTTLEDAQKIVPSVGNPWDDEEYCLEVNAGTKWWAFGNLNFALPQMNELSRVRVVYRVDTGSFPEYAPTNGKPFHVRLYDSADQNSARAIYEEAVNSYWTNAGWRVIDFYTELDANNYYIALTFDGEGLTCSGTGAAQRPPFYLKEVSVVPVKLLEGNTHVVNDVDDQIVQEAPEAVVVEGGEDSISEIAVAAKANQGIYDLQGRKLAAPVRGLNIINGVKTLIK